MDPFSLVGLTGIGSSLLGGLLGSRGAKRAGQAMEAGLREGQRRFDEQAERAEGFVNTGADRAVGYMQPYTSGGQNALKLYMDAIGVNGREAQAAYHAGFQDDPGFQAALDTGRQQIDHSAIFRGRGDSGSTMKELFQFGERERLGAFRDRMDRLSSLSTIGLQAGKVAGDYEAGRGSTLADIALKRGGVGRDTELGIGTARSNAITGSTNAWMGALKGFGSSSIVGGGGPRRGTNTLFP